MAIKKIDIYPQIYVYTKAYVDALVASPETEPAFSGNMGAWFGLSTDDKMLQYAMNPCMVDSSVAPLTIYDVPSNAINDINSVVSYQNLLEYFKNVLLQGTTLTDSVTYVSLLHDGVDFVLPKYSNPATPLPMRVRFFYRVTYGDDNLVAMFPTQVNGYYETVLNATRNFQFTTATATARWESNPVWKLFDKSGNQLDSDTGIETALTSEYDEFYISVNVPVLGKSDNASVNHYDINNFFLDNGSGLEISTISQYPSSSDLGELMAEEGSSWTWQKADSRGKSTYDNSDYYSVSARFSRTILFKVLPSQCIQLMSNPILNLTYLDQPAINTCATGYKTTITVTLADLTLSTDSAISLFDGFSGLYSDVSVSNPSDQLVENITYSLKMKKYAIRTRAKSTGVIDSWGSLTTIAGDGIDMDGGFDHDLPSSIASGHSAYGYLFFNYFYMSELADKCGYSLPSDKSIASSVFIFELTMSYGIVDKTSTFAIRLGYEHCISMRTSNVHGILQDASKKWSGIKDVALTITEVSDPDTLNKIESLKCLNTFSASLNYVSPVTKTIISNGVGNFGSAGSIGTYAIMSGTTTKTVILAPTTGRAWTSAHYANLQTGTAYLVIVLSDGFESIEVYNAARTIDIVAPPVFDITTTPDGSEIDDISEAGFSEEG